MTEGKINKRSIGTQGEDMAIAYMEKHGMKVLERNFRSRFGEVDIIGQDGNALVFVEVKYRRSERTDDAESAVTPTKIRRIRLTADYYRMMHGYDDTAPLRFDVAAIYNEGVFWYEDAF